MSDTDNPNVNNWQNDYNEWWEATRKEAMARAEKLDAEERMKYNDAWNNFSTEADAAGDWAQADWDEFKARVSKWWNSLEMKADETV